MNFTKTDCFIKVSIGEIIDKYTILEIKSERIIDPNKLACILVEMDELKCAKEYINHKHYSLLKRTNEKIWDLTNIIKQLNVNNRLFSQVSSQIFELNQCRFRIKKYFNEMLNSDIKEQKSYEATHCCILNKEFDPYEYLNISIQYDVVHTEIVENTKIYDMKPIIYVASGLLGDFILQLSVVCENYHTTGRRGIIYITGPYFRNSIETTYNDILTILKMQPYIADIHIGEPPCDVYLSSWRLRNDYGIQTWYETFLKEYGIHMGNYPWLVAHILCEWSEKTVIHISQYRFPLNHDFPTGPNVVLLNMEPGDLEKYESITQCKVCSYKPSNFTELCSIIYSCKLFIGALSMPLTLAHAMHTPRWVKFCGQEEADTMNRGLIHHIPNIIKEI